MDGPPDKALIPANRSRRELEFLPAALEVQETPASPIGRAIALCIVLVFTAAMVWSYFGRIDVVAVAQGKLVPSGQVKIIQPMALTTVTAVHVTEGQQVARGDLLIEFDPRIGKANAEQLRGQLLSARLDKARLRAVLYAVNEHLPEKRIEPAWPAEADPQRAMMYRRLLMSEVAEYRATVAALEAELARARAERETVKRDKQRREATLPLIGRRTAAMKSLFGREMVSEYEFLELEQQRLDHAGTVHTLTAQIWELDATIEGNRQKIAAQQTSFRNDVIRRLTEAEKQVRSLREELRKAKARAEWSSLHSPADGYVHQLQVHTPGAVVKPAQELLRIVPTDAPLQVEAWLPNKDIGFVAEGQEATVKIETFPFTRYGTLTARLTDISDDAIEDERMGLVFKTRATVERTTMNVDGREVRLTPGMTAALEMKTGERRVIEFFLAPLVEHMRESGRER